MGEGSHQVAWRDAWDGRAYTGGQLGDREAGPELGKPNLPGALHVEAQPSQVAHEQLYLERNT